MADLSTVARPYAKALFDLAHGEKKLPQWSSALAAAAAVLADANAKRALANPAFADATRQHQLGPTAYHGTVTWSWQQALFAAGLERQIARGDLPAPTIQRLRMAHERLWSVITKTRELRASELWSWRYVAGRYEPVPFGQSTGDVDESNAAQLWSTVYLAIPTPDCRALRCVARSMDQPQMLRHAVMMSALVKSMKNAPTIGATRNARGAGP